MQAAENERTEMWARPHVTYLALAYGISWIVWIAAWFFARASDAGDLLFNADLVWALRPDADATAALAISLVAIVATFGPMLAGIVASKRDPAVGLASLGRRTADVGIGLRWYGLALGMLVAVAGPPAILAVFTAERQPDAPGLGTLGLFLLVFFAFQMVTSGTEEIGWRGYLNEKLRVGRDFWDAGWAVGLPWAVWHFPVVVIMFLQQGMAPVAIVGSLAGFSIGIVAASILHAWFYERTESVFLNVFIHAAFNTIPLATALVFEETPVAMIANLLLWVLVVILRRRETADA
jgi:membrane protease YdiL (CAAX protease family)